MDQAILALYILSVVFSVLFVLMNIFDYLAKFNYFFGRKSRKSSPKRPRRLLNKNVAIIIAAKDEAKVIRHILASMMAQTYDPRRFVVYLVADNCTDDTAAIARAFAADHPGRIVVFERRDSIRKGANFAIQHALARIEQKNLAYDAYCYFDADNVLDENWLTEAMAKMAEGYEVVTSYRNSLNFKSNWITASYGIQFLKESSFINASRQTFKMTSWINGTGFCFSRRVLELTGGWNFNSLSHDIEFTQFLAFHGVRCGYAPEAVFYDEQPVRFKDSWRQRLRWSKGFLQVFRIYGALEFKSLFRPRKRGDLADKRSLFANFATIFPQISFFLVNLLFYAVIAVMLSLRQSTDPSFFIDSAQYYYLTPVLILGGFYLTFLFFAVVVICHDRKKIKCSSPKLALYALMYPLFMFVAVPVSIVALFKRRVSTNPVPRQDRN